MYQKFAQVYDLLMADVDYEGWATYIQELFSYYGSKPKTIIDLACGTGNITIPLAQRGYQMTGVDISQDMLAVADQKAAELGLPIQWVCQDIRALTGFYGRDGILCACDGLNYILQREDLCVVFERVYQALKKDGIFAFDLNSKYKIEELLSGHTFAYAGDDVSYIWENYLDEEQGIIDFELSFFVREGRHYRRFNETHQQRAYPLNEVLELLAATGFREVNCFEAFSFNPPRYMSDRLQFIAQK